MIEINNFEVYTTTPETHRLYSKVDRYKTDDEKRYFIRATILPGETVNDFIEVALTDIPKQPSIEERNKYSNYQELENKLTWERLNNPPPIV